jgi:dolichol-phosphate mannosyltransferase
MVNKLTLISIILPIFNEEKNIAPITAEIKKVFQNLKYNYEIIFIDDGSVDKSFLEIFKLAQNNLRIKALGFSRNFGKEIALSAGCHAARGQALITMDADLQHPPQLIPDLIAQWEKGFEVIYTVRRQNQGAPLLKKLTSQIYWFIFTKIASVPMEPHSTDFRLIDRKVALAFNQFSERGRIFRGIIDWIGFKRSRLEFTAPERFSGRATYSYQKLFNLALHSFTAFSLIPLKMASYLGILITSCSFLLLIIMIVNKIFNNFWLVFSPLSFVIVANTLLIGIVLICLGFIALYIARIHDETSNRPLYIIREKINFEK